jgi:hypothetical protein
MLSHGGSVARSAQEQSRAMRCPKISMPTWLDSILQDLRYALRGFGRSPAKSRIAVMTMALGIGGVTAVFSVVDRILFRSLPYAHQDRLVWFGMKAPINNVEFLLEGDFTRFRFERAGFLASGLRASDRELSSYARRGPANRPQTLSPRKTRLMDLAPSC